MWKRSQQHIITLATSYVIKMLARWTARLKCGYPCLSLLFLITNFAAVFSSPCDFHRWQNKCYHFEGMDHERTSQRSPDIPKYIFSCCSNWMAEKSRSKTITTNEYWNNWLRYTGLMLPTCKPTKLIYVIRLNVTSREFFLEKGHSAWRTEYFMRNETLLFGLLSYHVKNVV